MFYATVIDAGRVGFLRGPYGDYATAEAQIPEARKMAEAADCRAAFYT